MSRVQVKLRDLVEIKNGSTPSSEEEKFYNGNISWITPKDLSSFFEKTIFSGQRNISVEGYNSCSTHLLPIGTILLSSRAPIGLLAISGKELCTNQGFKNLIPKKGKVDSDYLYYFLKTIIKNIENLGSGTTFKEVSKSVLEELKIKVEIDLNNQKKISDVLSSIDSKIELNNKINSELKSMVKLIYEYWFVQFDYPDENGNPYKFSGGSMVYKEELGREIPEGWELGELKFWVESDKSGDWGKNKCQGNYRQKVSCIRGADINGLNGKGIVDAPERYILENNSKKILEPGDLIIEISGGSPTQSTGRIGYIIDSTLDRFKSPLICSNFCRAITLPDKKYIYNFIQLWNRLYDAGVLFGWEGKTSGIKNLLFESFISNYLQPIPEYSLVEKFYNKVDPFYNQIQLNLKENEKLVELRDWLLPMLMNGQVTVK